jgi:glycosyltransferase involved in cell wall biosynthesis
MTQRPRVVLVGGPDVDARLDLMEELAPDFEVAALGSAPDLAARFAARGFDYECYRLERRVNPLADLRTLRELRARFATLRPQLVHAFDTKPGVWGALAARRAGVPAIVITITGLGSLYTGGSAGKRLLRAVYERLLKLACSRADLTIFQNRDDLRQLVAAGVVPAAKTALVLGSGVRSEQFAPERTNAGQRAALRAELGLRADETVVTMIARVTRTKGVLDFVAAARRVRAQRPDVRFLLVGPGDPDSLDRLTDRELAELRKEVLWPGARRDIAAILAIATIFVLPSAYREGIPRVLLEAAAAGLPIVTTDSPGCNEVVTPAANGFFVAAGNSEALADAIARLAGDPALREKFGRESRRRAVEVFDLGAIARQTKELYRRVLGGNESDTGHGESRG